MAYEHKQPTPVALEWVRSKGNFAAKVLEDCTSHREAHRHLKEFDTVLAPILADCVDCYIYGIPAPSSLYELVASIARPERARWKVDLSADLLHGKESLWNAVEGRRGSVVLFVPADSRGLRRALANCTSPSALTNPGAGHSPSALPFAKRRIRGSYEIAVLFSRLNGLQYMDLVAHPELAYPLFLEAWALARARTSDA